MITLAANKAFPQFGRTFANIVFISLFFFKHPLKRQLGRTFASIAPISLLSFGFPG
jgi:hypothetical protein